MLSTVLSSAVVGIDAYIVEVEVDISNGLPAFNIVGLPDAACRESADRVRAAIKNSELPAPSRKITVNLAHADLKKEGSGFDLAIAVGILVANEVLDVSLIQNKVFCGELSLDGRIRPIPGILPRAASLASDEKKHDFIVPFSNAREAACVRDLNVYPARNLLEVVQLLKGEITIERFVNVDFMSKKKETKTFKLGDFSDVKGQFQAKRGLEIAAAGGHNVVMIGPPGSGKTMLAKRLSTILSPISFEEAVETTKIHSVAGLLSGKSALLETRPFRDPHHTISDAALV